MNTTENQEPGLNSKRRAIVVDDSRASRAFLRRMLSGLGFEVVEAGNGVEALERLRSESGIELALVDWNMPVMDGLAFVEALREDDSFAAMQVIMVSAESDLEMMSKALTAGADEFVIKPFTSEILEDKIKMFDR